MTQQLSILTGCSAGATESFVVVPFELVKIKWVFVPRETRKRLLRCGATDCKINQAPSQDLSMSLSRSSRRMGCWASMLVWRVHFGGQLCPFDPLGGMADWEVYLMQAFLVERRVLRVYLSSTGTAAQSRGNISHVSKYEFCRS